MKRVKEVTFIVETQKASKELVEILGMLYPRFCKTFPYGDIKKSWQECLWSYAPHILYSNGVFRIEYRVYQKEDKSYIIYFYCKDKEDPNDERFRCSYLYEFKKMLTEFFEDYSYYEDNSPLPDMCQLQDYSRSITPFKTHVIVSIGGLLERLDESSVFWKRKYEEARESGDIEQKEKYKKYGTKCVESYNKWAECYNKLVCKTSKDIPVFD